MRSCPKSPHPAPVFSKHQKERPRLHADRGPAGALGRALRSRDAGGSGAGSAPWPRPVRPAQSQRRGQRQRTKVGGQRRALPGARARGARSGGRSRRGRADGAAGLRLRRGGGREGERAEGGKASTRSGGLEPCLGPWGRSGRTGRSPHPSRPPGARVHRLRGHPAASCCSLAPVSQAPVGGPWREAARALGPAGTRRAPLCPGGSPCSSGLKCGGRPFSTVTTNSRSLIEGRSPSLSS